MPRFPAHHSGTTATSVAWTSSRCRFAITVAIGVAVVAVFAAVGVRTPPAEAQDGGVPVAVFDGRGIGHGLGLPLDGAEGMAVADEASAEDILERFFPGASFASADGLVRMLVADTDSPADGMVLGVPGGAVIRDGRTTAVAPSFPIRVPSGTRLKVSSEADFYRTEVLDDRSVSDTVEITGEEAADAGAAPETPVAGDESASTEPPDFPSLAASPNSLWIELRGDGGLLIDGHEPNDGVALPTGTLVEIVVEAERMHAVAEFDVETYLRGLDLTLADGEPLEPAALDAAVIAARTYALRAAAAEAEIGRYHVASDERAHRYLGDEASDAVAAAAERTRGTVLEVDGRPISALVTAGAGGHTAAPSEVFGAAAAEASDGLSSVEYPTPEELRWRVEMAVADVGRAVGYEGDATSVRIGDRGPSGRPMSLVLDGPSGEMSVPAERFHPALRLPGSAFELTVESRDAAPGARAPSPPFQELPGQPLEVSAAAGPAGGGSPASGGRDLPPVYVLVAIGALGLSLGTLLVANLQRSLRRRRERRAARRRHPTRPAPQPVQTPEAPVTLRDAAGTAADEESPHAREPAREPDARPPVTPLASPRLEASAAAGDLDAEEGFGKEGAPRPEDLEPVWHNEPEWLAELFAESPTAPEVTPPPDAPDDRTAPTAPASDAAPPLTARRFDDDEFSDQVDDDEISDDEVPETRSLREVLGWDDAPDWLDAPSGTDHPDEESPDGDEHA